MADKDILFAFMDDLNNWVKLEFQRRGVQDLAQAMAVAESLIKFKRKDDPKEKGKKPHNNENGGGDMEEPHKEGEDRSPKEKFKKGDKGEVLQTKDLLLLM